MSYWLQLLKNQRNLEIEEAGILRLKDNIYAIDAVNIITGAEVYYLVYDCSNKSYIFNILDYKYYLEQNYGYQPVIIFRDWNHEREEYRKQIAAINKARERKAFEVWFSQKISLYSYISEEIIFEVDNQGINYLEYPPRKKDDLQLRGLIYNLSFYELKKLFNVTGTHLFKNNVRYGLPKNSIGDTLRLSFKEYLLVSIYQQVELFNVSKEILSDVGELLGGIGNYGEEKNVSLPENFWFYHNGISIFSFDKVKSYSNQVIINPQKVSVINGAQTITNFYEMVEVIEHNILPDIQKIIGEKQKIKMDVILREIYVKAIIVEGKKSLVAPITYGLNTQIPIQKETILADSSNVKAINKILSGKIRILKDGEMSYTGINLKPLDFVKAWLVICNQPGKSKNFTKNELDNLIKQIYKRLQEGKQVADYYINKIILLDSIYRWWDESKKYRSLNAREVITKNISSYGKNYFGSFVLKILEQQSETLSDELLVSLYEKFEKELIDLKNIDLNLNDFKKDELSNCLLQQDFTIKASFTALEEECRGELINLLNRESQSSYTYAKTINNYFNQTGDILPYFRVVSLVGYKIKEAFAFPNSSFNELQSNLNIEYKESKFAAEIQKKYPLFVIFKDENGEEKPTYKVNDIQFIANFSFASYEKEAEQVYKKTIEAFDEGDEYKFPKSSDNMGFHVRPKAQSAEDVFEFTNGKYITKRTFWANKSCVEDLINDFLH